MLNKTAGVSSTIALLAATLSLPAAEVPGAQASKDPSSTTQRKGIPSPSLTAFEHVDTPLSKVLDDIAEKSGLILFAAVDTNIKVSLTLRGAVSEAPLIDALSVALAPHKIHLELSGRLLKVLPEAAARYTGPVTLLTGAAEVSKSPTIGTLILPLSVIDPAGLITTLTSYLPDNTVAIASADANALVLHGSQRELSRVITIARLLDGAPTQGSQIKVLPLKNADSSSMARSLGEVFSHGNESGSTNVSSSAISRTNDYRLGGFIAASDRHSNSLIMRGPAEVLYAAELLVHRLDTKRFEASEIRIFRLRYADAGEVATVISGIFPKGSTEEFQVEATTVPRVENRDDVVAVPDPRSNTLILRAPTSLVPTLGGLIETLDRDSDRVANVRVFRLSNADPVAVAARLQELFQVSNGGSGAGSPQATSALLQRAQPQTQSGGTTTGTSAQRQPVP